MTNEQEVTLGEIYRSLMRLEKAIEPLLALPSRVEATEVNIRELQTDMKSVRRDAAAVSGGLGVIAFLASWVLHK
jgi:hypothetical protein